MLVTVHDEPSVTLLSVRPTTLGIALKSRVVSVRLAASAEPSWSPITLGSVPVTTHDDPSVRLTSLRPTVPVSAVKSRVLSVNKGASPVPSWVPKRLGSVSNTLSLLPNSVSTVMVGEPTVMSGQSIATLPVAAVNDVPSAVTLKPAVILML